MKFEINQIWNNESCFIIGGGPSLKKFDFSLLKGKHVIGCNDAYSLGEDICEVCHFSDIPWWNLHKDKLASFKNLIITSHPALTHEPLLKVTKRYIDGLHEDGLGMSGSTGCSAINLAILLGAVRIFLMGFDMKLINNTTNWHVNTLQKPDKKLFPVFIEGFNALNKDRLAKFPHVKIYNLTEDSDLNLFPKISINTFFGVK